MTDVRLAYRMDPVAAASAPEPVEVRLSSPELAGWAEPLFPDYRVEPAGGEPHLELRASGSEFRLREAGGGDGAGDERSAASLPEAMGALEAALAGALVRSAAPAVALHGAGVAVEGGALLLTGPGGRGKSSLTAGLAARGHAVYGDDVILVDPDSAEIHPFKRLLKVSEGARVSLGLPAPPEPLADLWEDAFYHPLDLGSAWAEPHGVLAAVLPERRDEGAAQLLPVSGGEAVRELLSQLLFRAEPGAREFELAARVLDGARLHRLPFSRSRQAVLLLDRRMEGAPGGTGEAESP